MGERCFVILLLVIIIIYACDRNSENIKDENIIDYAFTELTGDVLLYSDGMHNAFTDLCVYNGKYYLCFRNSKNHAPYKKEDYGRVFVYMSHEGEIWNKICEISDLDSDLRDPKLIVDKYNRLVLYCGYSKIIDNELVFQGTKAGIIDSTVILQEVYKDRWLWRVTWYKGCAYSFAYRGNKMYLLKSDNGFDWSPLGNVEISDCNEAALYFREDKGCFIARTTYGNTLLG